MNVDFSWGEVTFSTRCFRPLVRWTLIAYWTVLILLASAVDGWSNPITSPRGWSLFGLALLGVAAVALLTVFSLRVRNWVVIRGQEPSDEVYSRLALIGLIFLALGIVSLLVAFLPGRQ